jgi:hypothetical protein
MRLTECDGGNEGGMIGAGGTGGGCATEVAGLICEAMVSAAPAISRTTSFLRISFLPFSATVTRVDDEERTSMRR